MKGTKVVRNSAAKDLQVDKNIVRPHFEAAASRHTIIPILRDSLSP